MVGVNMHSAVSRAEYTVYLTDLSARAGRGELTLDEDRRWAAHAHGRDKLENIQRNISGEKDYVEGCCPALARNLRRTRWVTAWRFLTPTGTAPKTATTVR